MSLDASSATMSTIARSQLLQRTFKDAAVSQQLLALPRPIGCTCINRTRFMTLAVIA